MSKKNQNRVAIRSAIESLEGRQLFAGGFAVPGEPLVITGTAAVDVIAVKQAGNVLTVTRNGVAQKYAINPVAGNPGDVTSGPAGKPISGVHVNALGGNDFITIDASVKLSTTLKGGAGNDWIQGGSGSDTVYGGDGSGGVADTGVDTVYGGAGNDIIRLSSKGRGTAYGHAGNDTVYGGMGNDSIYGGEGNDAVFAGGGNDTVRGDAGNDTLAGQDGNDVLDGGIGDDKVDGQAGDDWLDGGLGADVIGGGTGRDAVHYGSRTGTLFISLDNEAKDGAVAEGDNVLSNVEDVYGGSGSDYVYGTAAANRLYGNGGHDFLNGLGGNDELFGGAGNDHVAGGTGNDRLHGNAGDDTIWGEEGNDRLFAGAGDDTLWGNAGNDTIVTVGGGAKDESAGGAGADVFWVDADASEKVLDKTPIDRVNRIASFMTYRYADGDSVLGEVAVSKELNGQKLDDPLEEGNNAGWANFSDKPLFAAGGPSEHDVDQNASADCYFMATLSGIAKVGPRCIVERVTDLGDGTYAVNFVRDGEQVFVRVDGDLPTDANGKPYNAGLGTDGAVWMPIVEKAWAFFRKMEGRYESVDFGKIGDVGAAMGIDDVVGETDPAKITPANGTLLQGIQALLAAKNVVEYVTPKGLPKGSPVRGNHVMLIDRVRFANGKPVAVVLRDPYMTDPSTNVQGESDGYFELTQKQLTDNLSYFAYFKV